jgi:hypothetical protein
MTRISCPWHHSVPCLALIFIFPIILMSKIARPQTAPRVGFAAPTPPLTERRHIDDAGHAKARWAGFAALTTSLRRRIVSYDANLFVARTWASVFSGSNAEWPEAGLTISTVGRILTRRNGYPDPLSQGRHVSMPFLPTRDAIGNAAMAGQGPPCDVGLRITRRSGRSRGRGRRCSRVRRRSGRRRG